MNDWEEAEELEDYETGRTYKFLNYKHNEGEKSYTAFYWSPEEIYFEVWYDGNHCEGGLTLNEAMNLNIADYIDI